MKREDRWLLPEGIEEVLPPVAESLERLRRRLLDLYHGWGYELVTPPFIEFLESLLTGTGNDLDLQTFKVIDQQSGRLMGLRADMTPQVARIDAHQLKSDLPVRLCYTGTVLHTRGGPFAGSRSPLQIGAELFGHSGFESDLEVLSLMLETLNAASVPDLHLDIGHVGIFRALVRRAQLDSAQEASFFDALQRKAVPELEAFLNEWELQDTDRELLAALADLSGGEEVLARADRLLQGAGEDVLRALERVHQVSAAIQRRYPGPRLHFDLAELRGYHYHTGLVFSAYVGGQGQAIANGGRYDDVGRVFGRARPATGFSADLRILQALARHNDERTAPRGIFAPRSDDPGLEAMVQALRERGERVVCELPGQQGGAEGMGCDRRLERRGRCLVGGHGLIVTGAHGRLENQIHSYKNKSGSRVDG